MNEDTEEYFLKDHHNYGCGFYKNIFKDLEDYKQVSLIIFFQGPPRTQTSFS